MHQCPLEVLQSFDRSGQRIRIVVVPSPKQHKLRMHRLHLSLALHAQPPQLLITRPVRRYHSAAILNPAVDSVISGRLLDIRLDAGAVSNGALFLPRSPGKAKRPEIAVAADAGVLEEIPGPAHAVPGFEDGVGEARRLGLEAVGGVDTTYPCPDDDHVEVGGCWGSHDCEPSVVNVDCSC